MKILGMEMYVYLITSKKPIPKERLTAWKKGECYKRKPNPQINNMGISDANLVRTIENRIKDLLPEQRSTELKEENLFKEYKFMDQKRGL